MCSTWNQISISVTYFACLTYISFLILIFPQLYGDFADVFALAECKLAIVHCAGHYDPILIETLWKDIIEGGM